eukprot:TRINITY_DN58_c0_g2_i3.p2 TRINITY_DN58_c0_g2~~TRINITY_DN58_c0_g2_i3.p2  ORF type:complete len:143 (+),score=59.49 TRINITY_DN58_c0_g2_i3:70-498(+)
MAVMPDLPDTYPWVLLMLVLINFECIMTGFIVMGWARRTYGVQYPEMSGNHEFNCAVRAHYNFVEGIAGISVFLAIAGIEFPVVSAVFGLVYFIGRIFYAYGYTIKGPQGRNVGAVLVDIGLVAVFGLSIYSSIHLITKSNN